MSVDISEALDAGIAPQDEAQRQAFVCDTPERADWALRKLAKIRGQQAEAQKLAGEQIARIRDWLEEQDAKADSEAERFEALLLQFHQRTLAADPKAKTISLPHGTLKARQGQPKFEVMADTFLAWAKVNKPELVRVKEEAAKDEIKKLAKVVGGKAVDPDTGEAMPGVTVLPPEMKYSVEVDVDG